jgi:hypothetical protein
MVTTLKKRLDALEEAFKPHWRKRLLTHVEGEWVSVHLGLSEMQVLLPLPWDTRRRLEEAGRQRQEQIRAGQASLDPKRTQEFEVLGEEFEALSDAEVATLHLALFWDYYCHPGMVDLFGMPGGRLRLLKRTRELAGLPDLQAEDAREVLNRRSEAVAAKLRKRAEARTGTDLRWLFEPREEPTAAVTLDECDT